MFVENSKETLNLGKKLSHKLNPQSIVLLQGPIGAGKTSFVQGIAKGLSISEDITSPTFALSHHYNSGKIPLIHLDLYRLENVSSAKEVFFSEEQEAIQRQAILIIEWPELIEPIVDTTGAGDAFLAGLISKLITSGYPSNELEIEDCIKFASVCGLLTCLGEGAIEQQPYYEKVNKFLGSLISQSLPYFIA